MNTVAAALLVKIRCCFWSKLSNFGTNFAATRVMNKSLVKINHNLLQNYHASGVC